MDEKLTEFVINKMESEIGASLTKAFRRVGDDASKKALVDYIESLKALGADAVGTEMLANLEAALYRIHFAGYLGARSGALNNDYAKVINSAVASCEELRKHIIFGFMKSDGMKPDGTAKGAAQDTPKDTAQDTAKEAAKDAAQGAAK